MSTECIEIPGEPYPQTSELLTLPYCLSSDCNSVDSTIIIETKINTIEGVVRYVDGKKIKVGYNAVEAGYPPCYVLSQCEILSVRCYSCCDDRYFDLGSCVLTTETISAALGVSQLVGDIYLYSGDIADPDCLYKYSGFGPITDPTNWYDAYGNLAAQFAQLEGNSLATFLAWLASVFEGDGISFNVHEDGDRIIVTVGGGGGAGAASFSFDYSGGTITGNPNDGSGDVITNIIVKQPNAPTEPYDWFLFVNTTSKALFINVNGEAMMLGFLEDGEPTTCSDVIGCIVNNFDAGAPAPDQWALPEMVGPFWEIGSVIYGSGPSVADYSACTGTDLDDLILSLNACPSNPAGWEWINNGGVLTLCTPTGAGILTMEYGDVPMVKNFAGVPTVAGDPTTDLCAEIAECISDRNLIATLEYGSGTTEAEIATEFSSLSVVTVRWVDDDGDERVSYKHPVSGWYHPVYEQQIVQLSGVTVNNTGGSGSPIGGVDILFNIRTMGTPIPDDAKYIYVSTKASARVQKKDALATSPNGGVVALAAVAVSSTLTEQETGQWAACASSSFLPPATDADPEANPFLLSDGLCNSGYLKISISPSITTLRVKTYVKISGADWTKAIYAGSDPYFVRAQARVRIEGWSR